MVDLYILGPGHILIPVRDMLEFGRFMIEGDRVVAQEYVADDVFVSTVFVGVDYSWGSGPPLVFETAIFNDYGWDDRERYSSWEEAEAGHKEIVQRLRQRIEAMHAR